MELNQTQKDIIQGLKLLKINDDAIIGIIIALIEKEKNEIFLEYLLDGKEKNQSEILKFVAEL